MNPTHVDIALWIAAAALWGSFCGIMYERSRVNFLARQQREKIRQGLHELGYEFDEEMENSEAHPSLADADFGNQLLYYSRDGALVNITNYATHGSTPFTPTIQGKPLGDKEGEEGALIKIKPKVDL